MQIMKSRIKEKRNKEKDDKLLGIHIWLINAVSFPKRLKRLIVRCHCTLVDKASLSLNYFGFKIAVTLFNWLLSLSTSIGSVQFILSGLLPLQILNNTIVDPLPPGEASIYSFFFLSLMTLKIS